MATLLISACNRAARASDFGSMAIFGDSLSDVGNAYNSDLHLSPTSPYFNGRFSNGPLWVEDLATDLSLATPTPSTASGKDYAYGGVITGSGSTKETIFSFPNIGTQISSYLSSNTPAANGLFVVWGGGNDLINGQTNVSIPVNNIAAHVTALANAGAKTIIVPNLPALGEVPRFRGTSSEASMNTLTSQFNSQLRATLTSLAGSLHIHIDQLDIASLFSNEIANPTAYGVTNVTAQADNNGTVVPNPDQYLFWDDIHPTRVGHQLIANAAFDLVTTHNWIATTSSATWGTSSNWDPANSVDATWIANLQNTTTTARTATVSAGATVRQMKVAGFSSGGNVGSMTVSIQPGVTLAASQSVNIASAGVIDLQSTATLNCPSVTVQSGGVLSGGGTIGGNISNSGLIAPAVPKPLNVNGTFTQLSGGSIQISLAGTVGGQFSALQIAGLATLNGNLTVNTANGFVPLPGETFLVMTFSSHSGSLSITNATGYAGLKFHSVLSGTDLTLTDSATFGDANLDGTVNSADFGALASNFGASGRNWLAGDFNGDGVVNALDFNALASNYGAVASSDQPAESAMLVPEPAAILVFVSGLVGAAVRRRGRSIKRIEHLKWDDPPYLGTLAT